MENPFLKELSKEDFLQAISVFAAQNNCTVDIDEQNNYIYFNCQDYDDELALAEQLSIFFGKYEVDVG